MVRQKIRIGAVGYLNSRPLVHGLERGIGAGRVELSYAVPSTLARQMAGGELDIALLPVIELAAMPELELVPGIGITTRGPARSVLLVARCAVEHVRSVALDPESRTSNALVRVLFAEVWRRRPRFEVGPPELAPALSAADAAVRIGDKALFERPAPDHRVYDLGAVWTEATGLPFVFAAWTARPGVVDREIYRWLHESRRAGVRAVDAIAEAFRWNGRPQPQLARRYLTEHIHYRLGSAELRALDRLFQAAAGLGLIAAAPPLRMAVGRTRDCRPATAGVPRAGLGGD